MIEIDVLNGFRELPKDEAKAAIQKYAEENGIAVKKQLSVDNMIAFVLEAADSAENDKPVTKEPDVEDIPETLSEPVVEDVPAPVQEPETPAVEDVVDPVSAIMNNTVDAIEKQESQDSETLSEPVVEDVPAPVQEPETPAEPEPELDGEEYEIPANFRPMQLIGIRERYLNVPYWVLDWIIENGKNWKTRIHHYPHRDLTYLQSILFYIRVDGSVCVRESRNSGFHHLY